MTKDNEQIVYMSDGFVKHAAAKRGLELSTYETSVLVGELIGVIKRELDQLIKVRILRKSIEEAETEKERMELLLDYLDEEDVI